jgi:membrane protease YdiL (CAAX protease family)
LDGRGAPRSLQSSRVSSPSPIFARTQALEVGVGAAWLIGLAAALQLVGLLVGQNPLAAAVVGAVVVDLAVSRAGVRWDARGPSTAKRQAKELLLGAGVALAVLAVVLGVALAFGLARVGHGHPSVAVGLALLRAVGVGVRDELLFRGLVLTIAARASVPGGYAVAFAALAGGASIALTPGATAEAVLLTVASGAAFALLYRWRAGAWAAIGAHAAWVFLGGAALRGTLLDVTWTSGQLSETMRASGTPALLATLGWAACAVALALWTRALKPRTLIDPPAPRAASSAS